MVKLREKIEARSTVGIQKNTLRTSIPQKISEYVKVDPGDELNWELETNKDKPRISIEIIEAEKE